MKGNLRCFVRNYAFKLIVLVFWLHFIKEEKKAELKTEVGQLRYVKMLFHFDAQHHCLLLAIHSLEPVIITSLTKGLKQSLRKLTEEDTRDIGTSPVKWFTASVGTNPIGEDGCRPQKDI